jgi:Tol biopolymer transport system component
VQPATGELRPLAPSWRDISRVVWLKDGSGLLTIAARDDPQDPSQVWFIGYPRGEIHRITNDLSIYDVGLSVGLDSNSFLLVKHQQITNLWVGPADDFSKAKQITFAAFNTHGNFTFDWLPNGRIVYASSLGRDHNLWTMDADGQNPREITPPGNADQYPSAKGDGRFIVFESSRGGANEIWRADVDGSNAKQLTTCGKNSEPAVSPDGKWVVWLSGCDQTSGLWRVPIEGGQAVRLTDRAVLWPRVSPDSKWIACGYRSDSNKWQLAIISIEGGPPAKLFDVSAQANFNVGIHWTPDGNAIAYRDWGKGLWRQAIDGGAPQRFPGLPEEKIGTNGWSWDGKQFAFTRGVEIRDAVLVSNVKDE